MRRRFILGLLLAVACRQTSQERYTFAGCDDAGAVYCPRDLVFVCALDSIERKHGACTAAADCQLVSVANCFGYLASCPPAAVNAQRADDFRQAAAVEITRYCEGAVCHGSSSCAASYADGGVRCEAGRCIAVPDR